MKEYKRLKDPIYGYIQIPVKYMNDIVDTASFQRLRRILQTSYSPLYSSAVHNRFVHSMGVYYLGDLAATQLKREILEKTKIESLSVKGQKLGKGVKVSLLCDDDIIYLTKNVYPSDIGKEFFERRERRHPVWK